jgi:hypothetical protein
MKMLSSDPKDPAMPGNPGYRATGSAPRWLTRSLVIDVAMPWIAVQLLQRVWGVPTVPAFAVAAIFPTTSILLSWARHRRGEYIGIGVLVTILSGIAVALVTNDVRFAVLKGAPAFVLFGLACLLSLRRERPLMFFVGRQFSAGDDEAQAQAWNARLPNAGFRQSMRLLTIVWGSAALVEATLGITTAFLMPPGIALVVEPMLGIGTIAVLLTWTTAYARRRASAAPDQLTSTHIGART